ncbi:MAG: NAD(P)H-dependent oxidoreductase [Candidatus Azobacteroides sp.]|nr:NAD(P)H-dependent oxidoreductase [Candidatus Azobacteroides sp.]
MNVSVILGHPYAGSFNHAIAAKVVETLERNRHHVYFHDLYQEGFNPVIPAEELISDYSEDELVKLHCKEIKETEGIIIIHPNWWGQPPAILKGWVDRVFRQEIAYTFPEGDNGGGLPIGLLKAKVALIFNTSNTPEERENTVFGDPLENIWKACVFGFCNIHTYERKMYRVIADSTYEERVKWLEDAASVTIKHFPR